MIAAFFDVDGTITDTNVVVPFVQFQIHRLPPTRRWLFWLTFAPKLPYYFFLDKLSRAQFNIVFYRNYTGIDAKELRDFHQSTFEKLVRPKIFPEAIKCIERHHRQHHQIVLVTGALRLTIEPLAQFLKADHLLAARMKRRGGRLTGELDSAPLAGERKAEIIRQFARQHQIDLKQSYAYGNSISDLPMLECVGNPVAVNPDKRLRRLAEERGWRVEKWRLGWV